MYIYIYICIIYLYIYIYTYVHTYINTYNTTQHNTIQHKTTQYNTIQDKTIQYNTHIYIYASPCNSTTPVSFHKINQVHQSTCQKGSGMDFHILFKWLAGAAGLSLHCEVAPCSTVRCCENALLLHPLPRLWSPSLQPLAQGFDFDNAESLSHTTTHDHPWPPPLIPLHSQSIWGVLLEAVGLILWARVSTF